MEAKKRAQGPFKVRYNGSAVICCPVEKELEGCNSLTAAIHKVRKDYPYKEYGFSQIIDKDGNEVWTRKGPVIC